MIIFLKWGLVAGATFTLDLILFYIIIGINENIVLVNFFSYVLSSVFNFLAHKKWTFNVSASYFYFLKRYLAAIFLSLVFNTTFIFINSTYSTLFYSKITANLFMIPVNFYLMRKFTFKS